MARFEVQARVVDLLGEEQISDLPTAISELFKNAYDAYAWQAMLDVYRDEKGLPKHLVLWDNGFGMSEEDVLTRWLVVGTAGKKLTPPSPPPGRKPRKVMGEKGIGRLAISRLGESMLLVTRKPTRDVPGGLYTAAFINWNIVRNREVLLSDIDVPVQTFYRFDELAVVSAQLVQSFREAAVAIEPKWQTAREVYEKLLVQLDQFKVEPESLRPTGIASNPEGTVFFIGDPAGELKAYLNPDRDPEDVGEADKLLALLCNFTDRFSETDETLGDPDVVDLEEDRFKVDVRTWKQGQALPETLLSDQEVIGPDDLQSYDHLLDVQFDRHGRYQGTLEVYAEAQSLPAVEDQDTSRVLACGPFDLRLWYWMGDRIDTLLTDAEFARINTKLDRFGGLMVYRSGLRVLPYGRKDWDWLLFEERRSRGAGRYFFSYRRMFGYVSISDKNPELRDKAGREGLLNNAAYRDLRDTLIKFFKEIALRYFLKGDRFRERQEELKRREGLVDKAKKKAEERRAKLDMALVQALNAFKGTSARIESLRNVATNLLVSSADVTEPLIDTVVKQFDDGLRNLEGSVRVVLPADLSTSGHRELRRKLFDYRELHQKFEAEVNTARQEIIDLVGLAWPDAERRRQNRRLLQQALEIRRMEIGRAFSRAERRATAAFEALRTGLGDRKALKLARLKDTLIQVTGTLHEAEALSSDPPNLGEVVTRLEECRIVAEEEADQLGDRIERHLAGFRADAPGEAADVVAAEQEGQLSHLEDRLRTVAEMANVGLAVEIVEHDLGSVIHGIKDGIATLRAMLRQSERGMRVVEGLRGHFQHFEYQFQQLQPLYRRSYRLKLDITGRHIEEFILRFMDRLLESNSVKLRITPAFRAISIQEASALVYPVFTNLVDNAIYWLRRQEERLVVLDRVGDVLTVCDTGPGIHDSMLEEIFEAFVSTKPGGRGLGLHIARTTLELSRHRIWATNDPHFRKLRGACFCIRFSDDVMGVAQGDPK